MDASNSSGSPCMILARIEMRTYVYITYVIQLAWYCVTHYTIQSLQVWRTAIIGHAGCTQRAAEYGQSDGFNSWSRCGRVPPLCRPIQLEYTFDSLALDDWIETLDEMYSMLAPIFALLYLTLCPIGASWSVYRVVGSVLNSLTTSPILTDGPALRCAASDWWAWQLFLRADRKAKRGPSRRYVGAAMIRLRHRFALLGAHSPPSSVRCSLSGAALLPRHNRWR